MMAPIISGSLILATPPSRRMSAGTRSRAITATAPASSAIFACSGVTTSMITPPLSISAMPRLTRNVPVAVPSGDWATVGPLTCGLAGLAWPRRRQAPGRGRARARARTGARARTTVRRGGQGDVVVDLEVGGQWRAAAQVQAAHQPATPQGAQVANRVVMELTGQRHSRDLAAQLVVGAQRGRAQHAGQPALSHFALVTGGGERGQSGLANRRRLRTGAFRGLAGSFGATLELDVQGCPRCAHP